MVVWKDAPHGNDSSASDAPLRKIVEEALPTKAEAGAAAVSEFVKIAKGQLLDIAASGGAASIPGAGAVAGATSAIYKGAQAVGIHKDVEKLKEAFPSISDDLKLCSLSLARALKKQENDKRTLAAGDVLGAVTNAALSATVAAAPATAVIGALKLGLEKKKAVENLWEKYQSMQQANAFLSRANGSTDSADYFQAAEACPEVGAYVLATCDPDAVAASLGGLSLPPAKVAGVKQVATDFLKDSPIEVRTGEPSPPPGISPKPSALVGGDFTGEVIAAGSGAPKGAVERPSLFKRNQVVPFDNAKSLYGRASAPASATASVPVPAVNTPAGSPQVRSNLPALERLPSVQPVRLNNWTSPPSPSAQPSPRTPIQPSDVVLLNNWTSPSAPEASPSAQAYARTPVQALVEGE
ncbi:MAG TPA: hypothetical protein VMD55_03860 [Terracidiphilus sp.]|nr:hypothetical protein [Terracidiphilus sp.]